ncbi:MAG: hypothetical protein HC822_05955 [Oscillochloris sp.]|nr:hypothetical protein [Oscillochloris sp.]
MLNSPARTLRRVRVTPARKSFYRRRRGKATQAENQPAALRHERPAALRRPGK